MMVRTGVMVLFVLACVTVSGVAFAQPSEPEDATVSEAQVMSDILGRDTPLSSMIRYTEAADAFDWELASRYLDLRNLPSDVRQMDGAVLAEQLYFILQQRQVRIADDLLSDDPQGHPVDDLPEYRDELARISTQNGETILMLQKVPGPDQQMIWKVSNATVAKIPALYKEFSYPEWVENIRERVPHQQSFLGIELFKWVILLGIAAIVVPLGWVLAYLLARMISSPTAPLWHEVKSTLTGPILALVTILILGHILRELGVGAAAGRIMQAKTLVTIFILWFIWKAVDLWRARRRVRYEAQGRTDAAVLGRPVANAIKLVSLLLGILVWMANAGVDISALLTGLGIGGIAVALALQKPIEDLFGAISIYSQQPVSTGDLCRYGQSVGRVEEIGLRTTRIRTLSNSLVNVPNAQLSAGIIENLTARTKIMYHPDLPLRYDTSREQVEALIDKLGEMLREDPGIEDSTIRVRLAEFSPNAIVVRVRVFALTRDFDEYLEIIQTVNLNIMSLINELEISFAQGAQTLFIEDGNAERQPFGPKPTKK